MHWSVIGYYGLQREKHAITPSPQPPSSLESVYWLVIPLSTRYRFATVPLMPMLNGTDWFHETALTTSLLASVLTLLMSLMILQPAFGFGSRSHGLPDLSFKLAVDSTDISVKRGKTMPTFHEQRSLSERLHEAWVSTPNNC